tara:strand:- start:1229 stop:1618 length:390 start_codon:yes stop_codon:yes gene_type:complete
LRDTDWSKEKFDIDLEFGKKGESKFKEIFSNGDKVEVKTERDKWLQTGNLVIELECAGKKSGLSTTEADYWVHQLSIDTEIVGMFIIPVERLKSRVKWLVEDGQARVTMGGDGYRSKIALVPISKLFRG